jgi:hypothetical protein
MCMLPRVPLWCSRNPDAVDQLPVIPDPDQPGHKIANAILKFLGKIPETDQAESLTPHQSAQSIANAAAAKAATAAGALALPPGPIGWLTILPELHTMWKIQTQMIADIAGVYGKTAALSREQMVYCLFRHGAAMAVRDVVVRVGDRYLVRQLSPMVLEKIAKKIGVKITQKSLGKAVSRWLPVVGALGVGAYAFYDTARVAKTAMELFEHDIEIEPPPSSGPPPVPTRTIEIE